MCGRCYEVRCRSGNVKWDYNCPTCTEQLAGKLQGDVAPGAVHQNAIQHSLCDYTRNTAASRKTFVFA